MNTVARLCLGQDSVQWETEAGPMTGSLELALQSVQARWLCFHRAPLAEGPLPPLWERLHRCDALEHPNVQLLLGCAADDPTPLPRWDCCVVATATIRDMAAPPMTRALRPQDAVESRIWTLFQDGVGVAWEPLDGLTPWKPDAPDWNAPSTYTHRLERWKTLLCKPKLQDALRQGIVEHLLLVIRTEISSVPPLIPRTAYRSEDLLERLTTLGQALGPDCHASLASRPDEAAQTLLALAGCEVMSPVWADERQPQSGAWRLTYWFSGPLPSEEWLVDGTPQEVLSEKTRCCKLFQSVVLHQRIVWLNLPSQGSLQLRRNARPTPLTVLSRRSGQKAALSLHLAQLPRWLIRNPADQQRALGWRRAGIKARVLHGLAWLMRWRYRDAWLFIDRESDADDNAEHLYRWVRQHHPEINAWFVIDPTSPDGRRLAAEGFRLVSPGLPAKLLALNARHLVSSHAGQNFGLSAPVHGESMRWLYHFVCHGINKDDASNWLNAESFNTFFVASPPEHESIVADRSPYRYTRRDTHCLGLPRQDALLALDERSRDATRPPILLFMPTWRASLFDVRSGELTDDQRLAHVRRSEFVHNWRRVLHDPALQDWAKDCGVRLAFMAHANLVPVLEAFELPANFERYCAGQDRFQPLLVQCCGLVTDYSSVAFEMALLRRQVFYFQPDRASFYGGTHNWSPGYFSYDEDGFGPVVDTAQTLLEALSKFGQDGLQVAPDYRARMERAMPLRSGSASAGVIQIIKAQEADLTGHPGAGA